MSHPPNCKLDGHDEKPRLEDCETCRAAYYAEMAGLKAEYLACKAAIHCSACILEVRGAISASACDHCDPNLHVACEVHR